MLSFTPKSPKGDFAFGINLFDDVIFEDHIFLRFLNKLLS